MYLSIPSLIKLTCTSSRTLSPPSSPPAKRVQPKRPRRARAPLNAQEIASSSPASSPLASQSVLSPPPQQQAKPSAAPHSLAVYDATVALPTQVLSSLAVPLSSLSCEQPHAGTPHAGAPHAGTSSSHGPIVESPPSSPPPQLRSAVMPTAGYASLGTFAPPAAYPPQYASHAPYVAAPPPYIEQLADIWRVCAALVDIFLIADHEILGQSGLSGPMVPESRRPQARKGYERDRRAPARSAALEAMRPQ